MKTLTLICALLLAGITWSCGGGEKGGAGDSTNKDSVKADAPAAECPQELKDYAASHAEFMALVEKVKAGEEVTKEAQEAAMDKGKELMAKVGGMQLSEDCTAKFRAISWAEASANMAEARAKAGK
jgi:hypothetical protein